MSTSIAPIDLTEASTKIDVKPKLAYVVSLFPCWSETFIAEEIRALISLGFDVEIYSLRPASEREIHPLAAELVARTRYGSVWNIVSANLAWLFHKPGAYLTQLTKTLSIWPDGLRATAKTLASFLIAASFAREMQRRGIERIHAHWATYPLTAVWTIRALTGLPYSFTTHAHDLFEPDSLLARKIAETDFIVTISEYNRTLLTRLFSPQRAIHVIHCGVDTEKFSPGAQYHWNQRKILSVGRLTAIKGFSTLIEACRLLRDRGIEFQCDIVGEGELRPLLQDQIARAHLENCVRLCGVAKQEEVRSKVRDSALFVLACEQTEAGQQDGIPVALMEAMSCSVPVVSTRVSGVPELIDDGRTGLLVPQKDAVALASAIQKVLMDRSCAEGLALAARERILEQFAIDSNARRLADLLAVPPPNTNRRIGV